MFELILLKAVMEEVQHYLEGMIVDIESGELDGLDARIVVDAAFERAYGTRKGLLQLIVGHPDKSSEEVAVAQDMLNWASDIVGLCHEADELLGDVEFPTGVKMMESLTVKSIL